MTAVGFYAVGLPAPQGSKRHVGGGRLVESSKQVAPWRDTVTAAALPVRPPIPLDGPVEVLVVFTLPRPKSARKTDLWPFRTPDLDKLVRSTFDAITAAGIWADDARAQRLIAEKLWVGDRHPYALPVPGAAVLAGRRGDELGMAMAAHRLERDIGRLWPVGEGVTA